MATKEYDKIMREATEKWGSGSLPIVEWAVSKGYLYGLEAEKKRRGITKQKGV